MIWDWEGQADDERKVVKQGWPSSFLVVQV
jgi:hypothetical protein